MTTTKLPWATAAIIIVAVVAVGAWNILVKPTEVQPTPTPVGAWTPIAWGWAPDNTGIENVYFMDWDNRYDNTDYVTGTHENIILGRTNIRVIFRNPAVYAAVFTDNLKYNDRFYILATARVFSGWAANAQRENIILRLNSTGSFVILTADENKTGDWTAGYPDGLHVASGYSEGTFPIVVNGVWDNDGAGYVLPVDGSVTFTARLYTWY